MRDRRLVVGGVAWVLLVQFFVMHLVVQSQWPRPYSWRSNWISDLGKVQCGASSGAGVTKAWACSPWHVAMGVSFVAMGVLVLVGALALRGTFPSGWPGRLATGLFVADGLGWILVGAFPGDGAGIAPNMHVLGALLVMPMANIALVLLGISMRRAARWPGMGTTAIALGILGFVCVFLVTPLEDAGWNGVVQRLSVFPQLVWMIVYGSRTLAHNGRETTAAGHPTMADAV